MLVNYALKAFVLACIYWIPLQTQIPGDLSAENMNLTGQAEKDKKKKKKDSLGFVKERKRHLKLNWRET